MGVRFFVDNNLGRNLVEGLRNLGFDNVEHLRETFVENEEDAVWLKHVGEKQLILITKDKAIRHNPKEKEALVKYKVVAFFLGGKNMGAQEISKQLVNAWNKMEDCAQRQLKKKIAGAFLVNASGSRIDDIPLT